MQTIKQWNVTILFHDEKTYSFIISDDHYYNMLIKLQNIQFDRDPRSISISERESTVIVQSCVSYTNTGVSR